MQRKVLIGVAIILALIGYRFRWGVLGVVRIGPPSSACVEVEALNQYLRLGGSPSAYVGRTPLMMCAAENGSQEVVAELIAQGADVNAPKKPIAILSIPLPLLDARVGTTALYASVLGDHLDIARLLIEHGADVNLTGAGDSPLNVAISLNRAQILQMFLEADQETYEFDRNNILTAGGDGNLEVFEVLLDSELLAKESYEGALIFAARNGHIEVVRTLADRGVTLPTTLHTIAIREQLDTIDFLLQSGVDINALDDEGDTALHDAVRFNRLSSVQFLIERGARINERNHEGHTPLDIAVSEGHSEIEALLIAEGAVRSE